LSCFYSLFLLLLFIYQFFFAFIFIEHVGMGEKRQKNGKKDIQTEKEIDPLRDTRKLTDGTPMRDE